MDVLLLRIDVIDLLLLLSLLGLVAAALHEFSDKIIVVPSGLLVQSRPDLVLLLALRWHHVEALVVLVLRCVHVATNVTAAGCQEFFGFQFR